MPVISYRQDPQSERWSVDDKPWVCPVAPKFEGNTWEEVHQQIRNWLAPRGPVNFHDGPLTPTSRIASWQGLMYEAGQAPAVPTDKSDQQERKDEVRPTAATESDSDDDGDGYDMSLFD